MSTIPLLAQSDSGSTGMFLMVGVARCFIRRVFCDAVFSKPIPKVSVEPDLGDLGHGFRVNLPNVFMAGASWCGL